MSEWISVAEPPLPCPFCGVQPNEYGDDYGDTHIDCFNNECPTQPSTYPGHARRADAVKAWNTRAPR